MKNNKALAITLVAAVGACIVGAAWYLSPTLSGQEKSTYGKECADWISKNYGDGRTARVRDYWEKKGHAVFEIGVTQKDNPTMASLYLCVVDPKKGTMLKPSAFDQSWTR